MYENNLPENLVRLRAQKGITQEEIASALEVSNKTISKWENGTSDPDLSMLIKLADYYGVSSDFLLGIVPEQTRSAESDMRLEFVGLTRQETVLKAFDLVRSFVPAVFDNFCTNDSTDDNTEVIPFRKSPRNRDCISSHEFYDFVVCSEDVNMAVMLLRNHADFAWLLNPTSQSAIAELFAFLSDTDALKLCHYIHSTNVSLHFTADHAAKNLGISAEKTIQLLEAACGINLCQKSVAHFLSGPVTFYTAYGDGSILSLITLAYEYMCGSKNYNYCCNESNKMIGGNK